MVYIGFLNDLVPWEIFLNLVGSMSFEWHQLLVRRVPTHADLDTAFAATYRNDLGLSNLGVPTFNGDVIIRVRVVPQAAFGRMALPLVCATLDGHVDRGGARIDGPCRRVHLSSHGAWCVCYLR